MHVRLIKVDGRVYSQEWLLLLKIVLFYIGLLVYRGILSLVLRIFGVLHLVYCLSSKLCGCVSIANLLFEHCQGST
jgi:hypothetical protein